MFLITLHYLKPLDIVEKHLLAHRDFLEEGYKKDYFIVSGPKNPRTGGIILSQLKNREQLFNIIKEDPFYTNGIAEYDIIEFQPVKYHKQFAHFIGE